MTSIWEVEGDTLGVNANNSLKKQVFTATASQALFTLTAFTYAVGTGSLLVFKNGHVLIPGTDFTETSISSFTLTTPCTGGESVLAFGFVGISGVTVTLADALLIANNLSDLNNVATARTNLGVPAYNNGTMIGTVKLGGTATNDESLRATSVASAVNYLLATGAVTTGAPTFSVAGTDTNIDLALASKGTGKIKEYIGALLALEINASASAVNYAQIKAGATTEAVTFQALGSDTNIDVNVVTKGTGVFKVNGTAVGSSSSEFTLKNTNYTLDFAVDDGDVIYCTTPSVTYTFPTAVGKQHKKVWIANLTSNDTAVKLTPTGAETLGGATGSNIYVPAYTVIGFVSDNANWVVTDYSGKREWVYSTAGTYSHYQPPGFYTLTAEVYPSGGGGGGGKDASDGSDGGNGGTTSVGAIASVIGGTGGLRGGASGNPDGNGTAGTNYYHLGVGGVGGGAYPGFSPSAAVGSGVGSGGGGGGGSSTGGGGGNKSTSYAKKASSAVTPGTVTSISCGAGGSGGAAGGGNARAGANGAPGLAIVRI